MVCEGFLVLDHARVVFARIENGVLTCAPRPPPTVTTSHHVLPGTRSHKRSHLPPPDKSRLSEAPVDEHDDRHPLLEVPATRRPRRGSSARKRLPTRYSRDDDDTSRDSIESTASTNCSTSSEDAPAPDQALDRSLQLSGYLIDVIDRGADESSASLPFTFEIVTRRMILHRDGTVTASDPVESMVLSAVDRASQDKWMRHVRKWGRFGWRDAVPIAATAEDWSRLDEALTAWWLRGDRDLFSQPSAAASRPSRRRFYRTSGLPGAGDQRGANPWAASGLLQTHI